MDPSEFAELAQTEQDLTKSVAAIALYLTAIGQQLEAMVLALQRAHGVLGQALSANERVPPV